MLTIKEPQFEQSIMEALEITDRRIERKDLTNVRYLDCSNFDFLSEDLYILKQCSNLRMLDIDSGGDLGFLSAMLNLEVLYLTTWERDSIDLRSISPLRNLFNLMISGGDISGVELAHPEGLTTLKKLERLTLHEFGYVDLSFLEDMPWLLYFYCGYANSITNSSSLQGLTRLKSLELVDIEIDDFCFLDYLPYGMELTLLDARSKKPLKKEKLRRFNCREISGVPII